MLDDAEQEAGSSARRMIMKVVNSLSSKMEIGAPMAALYLLGNPDHYVSHEFVAFYWKNYTNYVQGEWDILATIAEPRDGERPVGTDYQDVGVVRRRRPPGDEEEEDEDVNDDGGEAPIEELRREMFGEHGGDKADRHIPGTGEDETIRLTRQGNCYMAKSNTDDY